MKTLNVVVSIAVGDSPKGFRMEHLEFDATDNRAAIHNLCHEIVSELLDDAVDYTTLTMKPRGDQVVKVVKSRRLFPSEKEEV